MTSPDLSDGNSHSPLVARAVKMGALQAISNLLDRTDVPVETPPKFFYWDGANPAMQCVDVYNEETK